MTSFLQRHLASGLLVTLCTAPLSAQNTGRFQSTGQELGDRYSECVRLADVDGDGDLDAAVLNLSVLEDVVWINDGTGQFTEHSSFVSGIDVFEFGDFDADGDPDLIGVDVAISSTSGLLQVWENDGVGNFNLTQQLNSFIGGTRSISVGDVNAEGDLDAFLTTSSGSYVATNNGFGTFTLGPLLGTGPTGDSALGDLDGDDHLDVFTARPGAHRIYTNDGSGSFSDSGQSLPSPGTPSRVRLVDLDGDEDLDAAVLDQTPVNAITFWINDGSGVFTQSGSSLGPGLIIGTVDLAFGDFDGDEDVDIFLANILDPTVSPIVAEPNQVFLNDGTGVFTDSGQELGLTASLSVALGDLDDGGDLDAFVANGDNGTETDTTEPDANTVWINFDFVAVNQNQDRYYDEVADAIDEADPDDTVLLYTGAFEVAGVIDGRNVPIRFEARNPILFGPELLFLAGDGSSFLDHEDNAAEYRIEGRFVAPDDGTLIFHNLEIADSDPPATDPGELLQNDASLYVYSTIETSTGIAYLRGDISADEVSTGLDGINYVARDSDVYGDYVNTGSTIIQRGVLYIYGDLTNTGTISGDLVNPLNGSDGPQPGDGVSIAGAYTVGPQASLFLPDPVWQLQVGGDFDIAIDDPVRFDLSQATVVLNGRAPGKRQTMETLGPDYPIGTLRIASGSRTVLIDDRSNAPRGNDGTLHVDSLVIESGASLETNGTRIFALEATIDGVVDDPDNIVIANDCLGDIDGDGGVDAADLGLLIAVWNTNDPAADLDGSGTVDSADLGLLIAAWGSCN
ncbi:MAG: VCBS repeat-containing protein [Planctomycetota bacterium]|nr:VCBS repeat-containing protein [Planctomycetota bacterium]